MFNKAIKENIQEMGCTIYRASGNTKTYIKHRLHSIGMEEFKAGSSRLEISIEKSNPYTAQEISRHCITFIRRSNRTA
jgi:hypothetical protein